MPIYGDWTRPETLLITILVNSIRKQLGCSHEVAVAIALQDFDDVRSVLIVLDQEPRQPPQASEPAKK